MSKMKTKTIKAQRKRIQGLWERWGRPMGLAWWGVSFEYHRNRKGFKCDDGREVLMRTHADWRYKSAVIEVNVPALADINDKDLDTFFVHELMHVFLNEMRADEDRRNHEERVATTLADAFVWIRGLATP